MNNITKLNNEKDRFHCLACLNNTAITYNFCEEYISEQKQYKYPEDS